MGQHQYFIYENNIFRFPWYFIINQFVREGKKGVFNEFIERKAIG